MANVSNTARAERADPAEDAALTAESAGAAEARANEERLAWRLPSPIAELERS